MSHDLKGVIDAVMDGLVLLDHEARVELINTEGCHILEVSAASAQDHPIANLVGPNHPMLALVDSVIENGRATIGREVALSRRFAENLLVDIAVSPLFDEAGGKTGVVVLLRDCTIQNSLQQVISEREQVSAFGSIAAGIAHEVKNPLGGIRGAAEILAHRSENPKNLAAAELIVREVDRIAALVDDFMVFTRGEDLRLQEVNIHRVLDEVIDLISMDVKASHVTIERVFDPSIPELNADERRLIQVFLNLMQNAVQAMGDAGGELRITTRMTLEHRLSTSDGKQVPTLLIEVADSGPGIPADVLEHLATPFFTTRTEGTGLGLAVSRHWISRHSGTLRIESTLGSGTQVRVALPLEISK